MNVKLLLAGLLALVTTLIHVIAGGADVVSVLLATPMDEEAKLVLYALCHMVSVTLGFSALIFIRSSYAYTKELLVTVKCIALTGLKPWRRNCAKALPRTRFPKWFRLRRVSG